MTGFYIILGGILIIGLLALFLSAKKEN